eukprot:11171718-Lingulodinium_polyedra.AAC.1
MCGRSAGGPDASRTTAAGSSSWATTSARCAPSRRAGPPRSGSCSSAGAAWPPASRRGSGPACGGSLRRSIRSTCPAAVATLALLP